jgi:hypothetical protein
MCNVITHSQKVGKTSYSTIRGYFARKVHAYWATREKLVHRNPFVITTTFDSTQNYFTSVLRRKHLLYI